MNQNIIFIPVLAHMLLVFSLYIRLGLEKSKAVKIGSVDRDKAALNTKSWPDDVVKVSNSIGNQFETPILFYVLTLIFYLTNSVNGIIVTLMGVYAASRYIHAYIHVTTNFVPNRLKAFLLGVLILLGLTIWQSLILIELIW